MANQYLHKIETEILKAELNTLNKNVYLPASQAYTSLETSKNTSKFLLEATSQLKSLCDQFSNIHLKLKPNNIDVRPFLWNNFICLKRYTYTVDLANINHEMFLTIPEYKKWQHLKIVQEHLTTEVIHQHIEFLKPIVKHSRLNTIKHDLTDNIRSLNVLNIVNEQGNVLASMIFNTESTEAQQLFYYISDENKKQRIGVYAQYAFMLYFKEQGYTIFDFCGANIPTIAEYKQRFPVKLEAFYELWYHRNPLKSLAHRYLFHQV